MHARASVRLGGVWSQNLVVVEVMFLVEYKKSKHTENVERMGAISFIFCWVGGEYMPPSYAG